ncbi:MAG TPA: sialidase family protein [Pyrinomonadaceae bacterium]|nr:sialidase family protein [Pyrinomonadaceae bacterium]
MSRNKSIKGILCLAFCAFVCACNRSTGTLTAYAPLSSPLVLVSAEGVDAAEPATSVAADGSFYVAWVNHEPNNRADVMIGRYKPGKTPAAAVRVNPEAGTATAWRGDQPSVAVDKDGSVYVVWTARVESNGKKGTDLYLSVSSDMGQSFGTPVKINDDKVPAAHGMHSLQVADSGRIYVSWLDERNVVAPQPSPKADGHHMESNRELFIADSTDGGRTFSRNRKIAGDACPCCKTALAVARNGTVYVSWRHVLPGNYRHIAVSTSSDHGANFSKPVIVSDDKWVLHGCPVSGPSLSVADNGTLKVLWYAAGEANAPGLYVAESKDKGESFSPRQLLAQETIRGTPVLTEGTTGYFGIAIWEKAADQGSETKVFLIGQDRPAITIGSNVELPAAAFTKDGLFVAYVSKTKEKRSVWLIKANHE